MTERRQTWRLDHLLVEQGLVGTRSRARDLILRGFVLVDGVVEKRPARKVGADGTLKLDVQAPGFVSRGGEKLTAALDHFSYRPQGLTCLDIGSSTGGFTQALLQRGAQRVFAVDVGREQLHPDLRNDPRVISLEKTDARHLSDEMVGAPVGCLVVDVSFVSLSKIASAVLKFVAPGGFAVLLVKPQFEVGQEHIGKGGVVRDDAVREQAVLDVREWLAGRTGWIVDGVIQSPLAGGSGNIEYLLGARRLG